MASGYRNDDEVVALEAADDSMIADSVAPVTGEFMAQRMAGSEWFDG